MLSEEVKKDALSVIGGLHSMNASEANTYAFCHNKKSVVYGTFRYFCDEYPPPIEEFDAYVNFNRKTGEYTFHECVPKDDNKEEVI